jgi:hypothetical protein
MELLLDKVNQNVQKALKKFEDTKQISEFIDAPDKYQSKKENIINREISELRTNLTILKRK